jgi:hydrogen peroxide-dependent heme synthase
MSEKEIQKLAPVADGWRENADVPKLVSAEGWHVLHLFYKIEHGAWSLLSDEEKFRARTNLSELVRDIRGTEGCQLLTFAMISPKADVGFMLLCADLQVANAFEKKLTLSLGPDILVPAYSFYSMTEKSEYTTTEAEYVAELTSKGSSPGTPEHEKALAEWRERMAVYNKHRLYPILPPWEAMCFYPMSKRRGTDGQNWYALSHAERKQLMLGHAKVGRKWSGKILQLITGCTGLDDWEWGVTLLAHDPMDLKGIVYEMRFDEVSHRFAEFGEFYVGLQLPIEEVFRRNLL